MSSKKKLLNGAVFLLIMLLTFYAVFRGQNLGQVWAAITEMPALCLLLAVATAIFFVSAEGIMIWYLLNSLRPGKCGLFRCISYSFIGFFYSGITPSATGGQPMQLYYMKKDGNPLADSSVVLMSVALIYKLVLVIIGVMILMFWYTPLRGYLREYFGLYLIGLGLNTILVVILLAIMFAPDRMKKIICKIEGLLVKIKALKPSDVRTEKIEGFVHGYEEAVGFFVSRKSKIAAVILFTFLQRMSVFFLTAIVYLGFSGKGSMILPVMMLQASVYIAVDMLPLPGSQGITELMYCNIFRGVFAVPFLMPSLYVTRGINFYFLLIVSLAVVMGNQIYRKRYRKSPQKI